MEWEHGGLLLTLQTLLGSIGSLFPSWCESGGSDLCSSSTLLSRTGLKLGHIQTLLEFMVTGDPVVSWALPVSLTWVHVNTDRSIQPSGNC